MPEFVFVESVGSGHGKLAIEKVKRLGFSTTFFTQTPDFYKGWGTDQPFSDVDRLVEVDTLSADSMLEKINRDDTIAVMALDDFHLLPGANLAKRLGLPCESVDSIARARFKDLTRQTLAHHGEEYPHFAIMDTESEIIDSPVGFPCVIKPTDGTGSAGVVICRNIDEMVKSFAEARRQWQRIRDYTLQKRWLVEEYISGQEYSAELIWRNGWNLLGFTKKIVTQGSRAVELGHVFPYVLPPNLATLCKDKISLWLTTIGLKFGCAHVEFRISNNVPVLMEINPRIGGDMIPELIRISTGFDLLEAVCRIYAGQDHEIMSAPKVTTFAAIRFLTPFPGIQRNLDANNIIKKLKSLPGVVSCAITTAELSSIKVESNYDRIGYVIATGATCSLAEESADTAVAEWNLHCIAVQETEQSDEFKNYRKCRI
jgi:S-sulfo-L-cysteine synthase (3-phospho-L-serine-dependent)